MKPLTDKQRKYLEKVQFILENFQKPILGEGILKDQAKLNRDATFVSLVLTHGKYSEETKYWLNDFKKLVTWYDERNKRIRKRIGH